MMLSRIDETVSKKNYSSSSELELAEFQAVARLEL